MRIKSGGLKIKSIVLLAIAGVLGLALLMGGCNCVKTVPAGHVAVASLFGDVSEKVYSEGLNFPVNPLLEWSMYDIREKSLDASKVAIPTKDQQTSFIDISVIYRINGAAAPAAKSGRFVTLLGTKDQPFEAAEN